MEPYRLYIDEVGNHSMSPNTLINETYLTLFGVILTSNAHDNLTKQMDEIKVNIFGRKDVIFHRKEILRKEGVFSCLWDKAKEDELNSLFLDGYFRWDYKCLAVTINKKKHLDLYGNWANEPYYYCLKAMLERYALFLHYNGLSGDVMIEGRNPKRDKELSKQFTKMVSMGTENIQAKIFHKRFTSKELKIKEKNANIAGLQLADLLAHPGQYCLLQYYGEIEKQTATFGTKVAEILIPQKFLRHHNTNTLNGCGIKLLP